MIVESIRTAPSSQIKVGAFTTGFIARNCSNVRKTETARCSNGMPMSFMEIATRRT